MHIQSRISALALVVAITAAPAPAFAQLNLGVDLNLGADGSGLGIGAGVDLGVGDQNLNIDAGVGVGGDSLVDADVDIGSSSSDTDGGDAGSSGISVDAEVLGDDGLVDADVRLGRDVAPAPAAPAPATPSAGTNNRLVDLRISALDDTARVDALVGRIATPEFADVDLDAAIDDTRVSIVALADLLAEDDLAEIRAAIEAGGAGRDELLAAVDASIELGSILNRNGLSAEDVVSLSIDANGAAELVVLDLDADLAQGEAVDGPLLDTDLAALDIDLLTDEELAEVDLALLPREDQRLDAIVRILGTDNGDGSDGAPGNGDIELVDLDTLLGEESLAELDAVLGGPDSETVLITADLLDVLNDEGLSPEAVIGVDTRPDRPTRVFVNAGLGDGSLIAGDLAQVDISIGSGTPAGGDGGDDGAGDGNGSGGGTDPGTNPGDGSGDGGTGNGDGSDNGTGDGSGNGTGGGGGTGGTGTGTTTPTGTPTPVAAAQLEVDTVVAEVSCVVGLSAISAAPAPTPVDLRNLAAVSFVAIEGCATILRQDELASLRSAVEALPTVRESILEAGLTLDDLVGATLEDQNLTLYFDARNED